MLNKVQLIGRLGADPASGSTKGGYSYCNLSVATSRKNKEGEEEVEWHRVTCWGKTAENCQRYLSKGKLVFVEGSIKTDEYEKDGEKRRFTKINAYSVLFLSPRGEDAGTARAPADNSGRSYQGGDDIPF